MLNLITPPPWRPALWLLTAVLATTGCKKKDPEPELSPATQTGANTVGCRLNGELWLPGGYRNGAGQEVKFSTTYYPPSYSLASLRNTFTLTGTRQNKQINDDIQLALANLDHVGIYSLDLNAVPYPQAQPWQDQGVYRTNDPTIREYITSPSNTGTLTITRLDTVAHVIAGTFSFTAKEIGGTKTVSVTDGRFDINYLDN